jgi:hypothetical protein
MFFDDDDGMSAGVTACSYTDEFLDAAVAKIDATFGTGFARQHPALVAGYLQASATNLSAFMTAAANMQAACFDEALAAAMDEMDWEDDAPEAAPPAKPRKKGRK